MMHLSIQDRLVPGATLAEKATNASRYGFDAIELSAQPIMEHAREAIRDGVRISAICSGHRGWLIDPDPAQVRAARADIAELLELGAHLGAGLILVPIFGRTRFLPNCGTGRSAQEDEALFLEGMFEAAAHAERVGATILLEAINRYQNSVCVTLADALRLQAAIGSPTVRVMGDAFHMNIEEADFAESLAAVGNALGYVHLGDSQRLEPGKGHLDFQSVFKGLASIGYDGYASMECNLSGDPEIVLPPSVAYIRETANAAYGALASAKTATYE
jgi:sugar phosphate isomerase/epimerase